MAFQSKSHFRFVNLSSVRSIIQYGCHSGRSQTGIQDSITSRTHCRGPLDSHCFSPAQESGTRGVIKLNRRMYSCEMAQQDNPRISGITANNHTGRGGTWFTDGCRDIILKCSFSWCLNFLLLPLLRVAFKIKSNNHQPATKKLNPININIL